jgi:hypothetical protein
MRWITLLAGIEGEPYAGCGEPSVTFPENHEQNDQRT